MGIAERKNRQKQALRERILDAARRIVVGEGFAALSMRKIADAIEYSPATLYLHFASRDDIARALCAEGYAQLLATFVPLVQIADPAERLKALGRAYVAFGVEHPETYRLIFMEDPSYTGAALGGGVGTGKHDGNTGDTSANTGTGGSTASLGNAAGGVADDDPGDAALHIMIDALDELRAAGHLSASVASMEPAIWAEALWASLHGIVALNLTCPVFPSVPLETLVGVTLDAWLGVPQAVAAGASNSAAVRGKKTVARRHAKSAGSTDPAPEVPTKRKAAGP
ncbi:AcrR family transcriptional regulator [Paraburkholderia sp. HC6.4b]|uniref:TetR/AcrR family transcriptional regulator n=1 Tax=unclassified Paraburkholderia TaxID=2615204 RepID=UPI00160C8BB1|nr:MULTISPECIES: TetR/AcrR family transcriptional regulator [unclassified Paraburkholderia]MBB5413696.1 AcrR family transcriptional regulator [Paraburkholderia sp. HC6.4b]MBB5456073.1 AcrR family transcriptional regulator [Paraburkholderia sp. Kb1A]